MDEILIFLLRKGAINAPVSLTTIQIGEELGMSQQNASRRILELEQSGCIERTAGKIRLTQKSIKELAQLYGELKNAFERTPLILDGKIINGLGEGKYYLSLEGYRKQIREKLGFDPYPGTLNIKLKETWKREYFVQMDPVVITGFKDGERTFGDLFAYKCRISDSDCAIVVPLRTHHPQEIIEVISKENLKERYKKKDGDSIRIEL